MRTALSDVWVYLEASPLLWLSATIAAYLFGQELARRSRYSPLVNPVAIAVVLLIALLTLTGTSYQDYFNGAQFVHFLLGPATVALAVPLYRNIGRVRAMLPAILVGLLIGSVVSAVSAVGTAWLLGASRQSLLSLAPKSVTTPIAMGIAEQIGGLPSLTAVLVILTGILGAVMGTPLLNLLGIRDWAVRGFAVGIAGHGIGTARAFQVDPLAGTFAGLAMGLNGLVTSIVVPLLARWLI